MKRKISPVDYEVDMIHKKKRLRIAHLNIRRRYHTTNSLSGMVKVESTDSEDENFEGTIPSLSEKRGSGGLGVVLETNLDGEQQEQLREGTLLMFCKTIQAGQNW